MPNNLKKVLDLIKKTGDKFILSDKNGDPAYVVMNLNEYVKLVELVSDISDDFEGEFFAENTKERDLTEKEVLDKINRELSEWQQAQEENRLKELEEDIFRGNNFEEDEDRYYLEPID